MVAVLARFDVIEEPLIDERLPQEGERRHQLGGARRIGGRSISSRVSPRLDPRRTHASARLGRDAIQERGESFRTGKEAAALAGLGVGPEDPSSLQSVLTRPAETRPADQPSAIVVPLLALPFPAVTDAIRHTLMARG